MNRIIFLAKPKLKASVAHMFHFIRIPLSANIYKILE